MNGRFLTTTELEAYYFANAECIGKEINYEDYKD
jgi:hypothetical protein